MLAHHIDMEKVRRIERVVKRNIRDDRMIRNGYVQKIVRVSTLTRVFPDDEDDESQRECVMTAPF